MNASLTVQAVAALARQLGRELTDEQASLLTVYLQLLTKWNAKMNLVGPRDWQTMLATLVLDSWYLGDFLSGLALGLALEENIRTLDLGAGAGLPGIPLRVFWDKGEYVLVEPRQKRAVFMQTAIRNMRLKGIRVAACRVEQLTRDDVPATLVVSRAFCPWRECLGLAASLVREQGYCLIMSRRSTPENIPPGWQLHRTSSYPVDHDKRWFWLFVRE